MYKLEGDWAQVTAKLEEDLAAWSKGNKAYALLQSKGLFFERVTCLGCLIPLLGLFLYGFNITPDATLQSVLTTAGLVFFAGLAGRIFIAVKEGSVYPCAYDLDLMESYKAFLGRMKPSVCEDARVSLSLRGHFARDESTRTSRKSLKKGLQYPAMEGHEFSVLEGVFQLKCGVWAQLNILRRHEAELHATSGAFYDRSSKQVRNIGIQIEARDVKNEDLYRLSIAKGINLGSECFEGAQPEITTERGQTVLTIRIQSETMKLELEPAGALVRAASRV